MNGSTGPVVLGIDTATSATAVALALGASAPVELRDDPPAGMHPGHATRLLGLAEQLLVDAGIGWQQVDRIAVGLGPGTFTGLRVGVATARGLAQARGLPIVGVSSLAALAAPALSSAVACGAGVLAVIDARRGEAFAAAYVLAADGSPAELAPPRPLAPDVLSTALPASDGAGAGDGGTGAEAGEWLAVGDGAVRYRAQLEYAGLRVPEDASPLHLVTASAVCALGGAGAAATADVKGVVPDYRRRPDAELALEGRRGRSPANASE